MENSESGQHLFVISGDKAKSLLLTDNAIQISSKSFTTIEDFLASWDKTITLNTKMSIAFDSIKKIFREEGKDTVCVKYKTKIGLPGESKFAFTDEDAREEFFKRLQKMGFYRTEEQMSAWKAVLSYAFGLFITAGVTWVLYNDASEIEAGSYLDSDGHTRSERNARLFAWVAQKLGTKGSLIAGGIVAAYCLYMIWKRYSNPPNQTILSREI